MAIMHLICRQMSDKAVTDGPIMHPGRSARTLKMNFAKPVTYGFFWFFNDQTVCSVNLCFCSVPIEAHPGVMDDPPQGPG
jgi:hypothetical protein